MTSLATLDDRIPFVAAALHAADDRTSGDRAIAILRGCCAQAEVTFLDTEGARPGLGVFAPRGLAVPVSPERVAVLVRSWERFDRAFAPVSDGAARGALVRGLWPLLDATHLVLPGEDLDGLMVLFGDGSVAALDADRWASALAEWATARRFAGRAWQARDLDATLEGRIARYDAFRRGARATVRRLAAEG